MNIAVFAKIDFLIGFSCCPDIAPNIYESQSGFWYCNRGDMPGDFSLFFMIRKTGGQTMSLYGKLLFFGLLIGFSASFYATCYGFNFDEYEREQSAEERGNRDEIQRLISVSCAKLLKNRTIALVVAQRSSHDFRHYFYNRAELGDFYPVLNAKLRRLGLKTFSPSEIKARIADAEMQAFLNNDQDAALNAASRLGAAFFIKGVISTRTQFNPVVHIDEIFITMDFTLTDRRGREISAVTISDSSFSNADIYGTMRKMVREKADYVVARLYHDYCTDRNVAR